MLVVVWAFDFPENSEVMVVAKVAGLDMSLVQEVMMTNFVAPELLNVGILKLLQSFLFSMVHNLAEMILSLGRNNNNFVSHWAHFLAWHAYDWVPKLWVSAYFL